jgi:XTP/dITP diphosphohydrolase
VRLLIATTNPGKLRELRALLADLKDIEVVGLDVVDDPPEVVENAPDFAGNAIEKATQLAAASNLAVLADDSGLEVDALGGAPGVRSARYAGAHANDDDNNAKLIAALRDVPPPRTARYRVVLALCDPSGRLGPVHTEDGVCEGSIVLEPRGNGGFGYDPYFVPEGDTRTMAELSAKEKNAISHRARATKKMAQHLRARLALP